MTCACGVCRRCKRRVYQARYYRTGNGKRTSQRYDRKRTPAAFAKSNNRRIFVGPTYYGRAATVELAAQINSHIKERVLAAKQRFADREEAEGAASGRVSPEAAV